MSQVLKSLDYGHLYEHSQDSQTIRFVRSIAKVTILGVEVDKMELSRETLAIHSVLTASTVLPTPVGVELSKLVGGVQRSPGQTGALRIDINLPRGPGIADLGTVARGVLIDQLLQTIISLDHILVSLNVDGGLSGS